MLVLIFTALFVIFILYLLVKPYISPLSHLPEPKGWPVLGHTPIYLSTQDHVGLQNKWAEQFSKQGLFKTRSLLHGSECVHVVRTEWAKHMWQKPDLFKRTDFIKNFFPLMKNGLFLATGDAHRFHKKMLSKAFSKLYLANYVPTFDKHAKCLIDNLNPMVKDEADGLNVDIIEYTGHFSFNILGEIAFGFDFDSSVDNTSSFIQSVKKQCESLTNVNLRLLLGLFPFARELPGIKEMTTGEDGRAQLIEVLQNRKKKIEEGTLTETEKKDLLSVMIEERDEKTGKMFSDTEIQDNCYTFMIAGYETTATAIPICLYHLAQYPEKQEKVREEVIKKLGGLTDKEQLEFSDFDLPYLSAFIKESLRFFPTVNSSARVNTNDTKLGDYHIPKGTFIFLYTSFLNRDPELFDYPDEFIPERFLPDSTVKASSIVSFGYGPYSCIGKTFALLEMRVMIARLLQQFRFTLDDQYNDNFTKRKQFLAVRTDPSFIIRFHKLSADKE